MRSVTYVVGVGRVVAEIVTLALGSVDARTNATTLIVHGVDSFASAKFASRFERALMPKDIGGDLISGTDGHCCLGVALPAPDLATLRDSGRSESIEANLNAALRECSILKDANAALADEIVALKDRVAGL